MQRFSGERNHTQIHDRSIRVFCRVIDGVAARGKDDGSLVSHPHLGALQQQRQSTPHAAEVPCSPILYALIFWLCRIAGSFRSARMADSFGFSDGQQNTVTSRPPDECATSLSSFHVLFVVCHVLHPRITNAFLGNNHLLASSF